METVRRSRKINTSRVLFGFNAIAWLAWLFFALDPRGAVGPIVLYSLLALVICTYAMLREPRVDNALMFVASLPAFAGAALAIYIVTQ